MKYYHMDVFSAEPLSGNGLTVVFPERELTAASQLAVAREFKQFETIFIYPQKKDGFPVRIFTTEEELSFAGHPVLGAGAVIHHLFFPGQKDAPIQLILGERIVPLRSRRGPSPGAWPPYTVTMNQGVPQFIQSVAKEHHPAIAAALNVNPADLAPAYPLEVVSTGLPYLLVPLRTDLAAAKIATSGFEAFLAWFQAKFVYVFNPETLQCRTWDNQGLVEDVATGSAAGALCAYLVQHGFRKPGEVIQIQQGKYVSRPTVMEAWVAPEKNTVQAFIRGDVSFFSRGETLH